MNSFWQRARGAGVIAATTIGAGVFALPYIFNTIGLGLGLLYLSVFSLIVIVSHVTYWAALQRVPAGRQNLAELAKIFLGERVYWATLAAIALGLLLSLVVYLILGGAFMNLLFPKAGYAGIFVFWILSSLPLFMSSRRFLALEFAGVLCMVAAILFIFFSARVEGGFSAMGHASMANALAPFGAILFALGGWTAIEPAYRAQEHPPARRVPLGLVALGTIAPACLYLLFVFGILGSVSSVAPDTVSGLLGWPAWKIQTLAFLGLVAIWTSYVPVAGEIVRSFSRGRGWTARHARSLVFFAPIVLLLMGFDDFLRVVGLAGGVFLALQYLFIALAGERALALRGAKKFFLRCIAAVFVVAAISEVYYFFVKPS